MNMSSNARRQGSPQKRSSINGVTTRIAGVKVLVFLTLVILTAVFSASALTANVSQSAAPETASVQESGFFASSFNNILSFFGLAEAAPAPQQDAKVRGCDTAPEGLLACYRGDNDTSDFRGIHNGEWVGTYGYATGKVGAGAFNFDGRGQVVVADAADLNPTAVTVDGWVNLTSTDGDFALVSKGEAFSLRVRNGQVVFTARNADGEVETLTGRDTISTGKWVHIAATHDGSLVRLYIDGEEAGSLTSKGLTKAEGANLVIGAINANENAFTVNADEVKLFGRALTAKEVGDIAGNRPDAPEEIVAYTIAPSPISEAGGNFVTVTVNRAAPFNGSAISVNFAPVGGTATAGASCGVGVDYVMNANSVSYIAGEVGPKFFTIQICDDAVAEGAEIGTIRATIVGGADFFIGVPGCGPGTVCDQSFTINDDDLFAVTVNGPVNEGGASTTVGSDGTGVAPPAGSGNALTYAINRGGTSGAVGVGFSFSGTARYQVNVANQAADFSVGVTGAGCTLTYAQGAQTGTVNFGAASTTCNLVATAYADDFVETNETLTVTLTAPAGSLPAAPTTGTFNNDDLPWLSILVDGTDAVTPVAGRQFVEEGTPGPSGTLAYTVTKGLCAAASPGTPGGAGNAVCPGGNPAALTDFTGNFTYSGTAALTDITSPQFNTANFAVTLIGGAPVIQVTPVADIEVEADETATITINANAGVYNVDTTPVGGVPAQAANITTGFINDDDEDVSVTVAGSPISEAGPGALTYNLTRTANSAGANQVDGINPTGDAITVNFTLSGTAACNGTADYTVSGAGVTYPVGAPANCQGTVAIAANVLAAAVTVTPTNDLVPENQETVIFTINANGTQYGVGSPNAAGTNAAATAQITNDDFQVIVNGAVPAGVLEDGATNLVYTFTRIGDNAPGITNANYIASGSATPLTDYAVTYSNGGVAMNAGGIGTIFIPVGNSTVVGGVNAQTATLIADPVTDATVEADEEVQIQVDNFTGGAVVYTPGNPAQASGLILNDDAVVSVAVAPVAVLEDGATNLVYTFTRTGGCGAALTVNYTTSGTATAGTDYTGTAAGANTVTFAAGLCNTTVTVDPTVDGVAELDETVILTINAATAPNQYTIAAAPDNAATGTIQNDDSGVSVTVAPASVNEDGGVNLVYTFTRTGVTIAPLTVNYTIGGTATNGTDYAAIGTSVPFAANQTVATVNVTPIADAVVEPDETVIITVVDGTGYSAVAPTSATGTITNDDADIVCTGPVPASVNENSGTAMVYSCTRTGLTATALAVPFTLGGTATFATDYTVGGNTSGVSAAGGTLNFGAGVTTATVTATPVADVVVEDSETVIVTFTTPAVYTGFDFVPSPTVLTGTIGNDDQDVSVAVSLTNPVGPGNSVVENGTVNLLYTFTRNPGSAALLNAPLTVNFTTTGTATSGTDYTQTSTGTITFAAGSTTATMVVDPTPDAIVEPDETVIITVTSLAGSYQATGTPATGTILNDDTSYTIQFIGVTGAPVAGEEGDPGDPGETIATFRVFRNGVNSTAGAVSVSTVPGSGTAVAGAPNTVCAPGQDYTSDGQTLQFAAGTDTFQDFTVRICRDLAFELTETFDAQLSNPTGGGFLGTPGPVATATIVDDDNAPVLTIANQTVNENAGTVTMTVVQSVATGLNTTFSYNTGAVGDTATAGADYTSTTSTGTIAAGATSTTFTIPIIDDNIDEPNETFTVTITAATNASITAPGADPVAVVTIVDNEPNTQFSINDVVQIEGNTAGVDPVVASTSAFNFRITRTGDAQASETVCFETVNGDIENPAVNPNPATAGPNDASALSGASDYTPRVAGPTNCVTFTQGGPSVITVPVIVYGDNIFEFDEYFTVRLLTVNGVANPLDQNNNPRITDALGLGTIQNDDLVALYTIAQTSPANPVTEGNSGQFNVTYTVTRTQTAVAGTVDYATSNGTGTSAATGGATCGFPVDYLTRSGTLTFAAGVATQTFTVPVCGDTVDELNESFAVTLSNPTFGALGSPASVTTTITDDDAAPIISVSDVSACEVNSPDTQAFVFTITRAGASALTSTVTVNTVSGTAVSPGDFVAINGLVVTFAPGETTKTVTVTVNGDNTFETDESFTLQIVAASSDLVVDPAGGADPIGLGVIQNVCAGGDPAPSFAIGPVTQAEGTDPVGTQNPFFVRLTRTGATEVPGTLTFATANITGQATGGASCTGSVDYISQAGTTVNFPAGGFTPLTTGGVFGGAQGANFVDIPVQVCRDAVFEPNETLNATLTAVQFAQVAAGGTPALVTITNDDGLSFRIRFPGPEGAEGNVGNTNFTFTIDRIGDSSVSSTVCYETVNGTASAGSDYVGLPATTCSTFAAGTMSVNVPVAVIGDLVGELDETFFLRLVSSSAAGSTIDPEQRLATILNDDGVPPPPVGVEGDVVDANGGAAGDGLVQANDVTAIRNFILSGTAPATTPNQFQRADVNLPCGNGQIDAGDVTVIRNMILGTTPNNTPACGPTAPAIANEIEVSRADAGRPDVTRVIRAVNTSTSPGQTVTVAFQLDSQGDETSLAFTANWNPAVFTYVSSAVGNGVPAGANFGVNATQTAQGRLGVLIDSTNTYAAGTRQIATITFTVAANAAVGTYPVTFSSTPTGQSVSNAQGALLTTAYEQGNIVITVTAAGVRVSGRVTTANGQGLRNATVFLTDSEGNRRTATTGSFGIYTFEDVESGASYVVGVSAKRYRFTSRVVNVTDSLTDVNFVGQE